MATRTAKKAPSTPEEYIATVPEPRRTEVKRVHDLIRSTVPELKPFMQSGMIGYGPYHYRYETGREGDWFIVGLAGRKNYVSLYVTPSVNGRYLAETYAPKLPKADVGKSCIRFRHVDDLDQGALKSLLRKASTAARPPQADQR
jgi:uncharacterized protein YdhG (YjbR/CyaY superfamily)